jgi:hypothetical protein
MRRRRFAFFEALLAPLPRPVRILDLGGTLTFWETMGIDEHAGLEIVLLNLTAAPVDRPHFRSVAGDARAMPEFADQAFDVVFSNSVIEHVGSFEDQRRMAQEVQRVGQRYFIQTPNRYFPIEPHYLMPGFQFYPIALQVLLVKNFSMGWYPRQPHGADALAQVRRNRLLTAKELRTIFPQAHIYHERMFGLTKSFIAYGGWEM